MGNLPYQELASAIDRCLIRDRFAFRRALQSRQKRGNLVARVERSIALAEQRRNSAPNVTFPEALPVSQRLDDIRSAILQHQVVIISGETGSGKTTQLPKLCLDMGRGVFGTIGHTQPRRVAARTVSHRIAEELGVTHGEEIGYQVRFTDNTSPNTLVKVMTDGILLAETQADRFLEAYDTLIIDEAHERSLNIDFLLGYLKRILPRRPDLKVIVTSATIDVARFSAHFGKAPIIEVSGRTYPVEVHYRPPAPAGDADEQIVTAILETLREIVQLEKERRSPGDVLVFLPGEREIRDLAHEIRRSDIPGFEVLPLYSRLGVAEQNRVFQKHTGRRVILATNVAETSLTVSGIRYVIDPGLARISRYSIRSKVQQLPIEPISQASAEQRKGRCGRVSDGVCFRLYSEADFLARPAFTAPEILRTNLAAVILQMLSLRLGDISKFPFVERPDQRQINDGFHLLKELQAVDERREITRLGKEMARLPLDLRLARMLLEAGKNGCLAEVLTIVAAMSLQDPRDRPAEHQQAADEKHRRHWHEQSDFMSLVNLWHFFEAERQQLSQAKLRAFCRENFLSYPRMREWRENHRQLHLLCKEMNLRLNHAPADYASIHRSLLAGLLGNIGEKTDDNEYLGARNRRHFIFPGSSQFRRKPRWIMSAELVETTRLFGRTVAEIDNTWIEPLARHLVKRNYHEPWFDPGRGQVLAREEVMLYGLSVIRNRVVDFGSVNPVRARQLFIQHGLVERELDSQAPFFKHNTRLVEEIQALESRARKRDLLVDGYTLFRFYDERLPEHVCSEIDLDLWRKQVEPGNPKLLFLERGDLLKQEVGISEAAYPASVDIANTRLALDYHFDPQHADDGVSVVVPVALLRQVAEERLDWLIPGLLREKCLALIRSLPKSLRKNFVPAPEFADRAAAGLEYDGRSLQVVLAEKLFRLAGVRVSADAFDPAGLERHLRMNIRVVDEKGQVLASGRDLASLQARFAGEVEREFQRGVAHELARTGLTDWSFGDLPDHVEFNQAGIAIRGYPALVDHTDTVAIEILDNPFDRDERSRQGLLRLFMLQLQEQRKYLVKHFPGFRDFVVFHATRGSADDLLTDLVEAVFRFTFVEGQPLISSRQEFDARLSKKVQLIEHANLVGELMGRILKSANLINRRLDEVQTDLNKPGCADIRGQLDRLLGDRFLRITPVTWLKEFPRYLAAIEYRLEKMRLNLARDRQQTAEIQRFEARYDAAGGYARSSAFQAELADFRWMLEEYRVSLFAQPLGTSVPVSAKRLDKEWQKYQMDSRRASR
ncbi:MAG: ATP-dependent RNA helicase HrpA [Pseudomonadota bacterium]